MQAGGLWPRKRPDRWQHPTTRRGIPDVFPCPEGGVHRWCTDVPWVVSWRPGGRVCRRPRPWLWKLMPYKFNQARRHKIPKARYRVTNWPEYDAALVRRGDLTVWFTDEAVAAWHAPATGE